MLSFATLVLWLHVAAIVFWAGGLLVVSLVFLPVLRGGLESPHDAARLFAAASGRFLRISREIIVLVLLTGIFNVINAGVARGFAFSPAYIAILLFKIGAFVTIAGVQVWQAVRLAPALFSETSASDASASHAIDRGQRRVLATSVVVLLLSVLAILGGLLLRLL